MDQSEKLVEEILRVLEGRREATVRDLHNLLETAVPTAEIVNELSVLKALGVVASRLAVTSRISGATLEFFERIDYLPDTIYDPLASGDVIVGTEDVSVFYRLTDKVEVVRPARRGVTGGGSSTTTVLEGCC